MKLKSTFFILFIIFVATISLCFPFNSKQITAEEIRQPKVYITNTGNHYHGKDCHYLRSKIAIGLYQAKERGYSACSYCGGEPDGWDYFSDNDSYPIAPDDDPNIAYPPIESPQGGTQSNEEENKKTGGLLILEILSVFGLIAFVIFLFAPHRS